MEVQPRRGSNWGRLTKTVDSLSNSKRGGTGFCIRICPCRASTLHEENQHQLGLRTDLTHPSCSHWHICGQHELTLLC